MEQFNHAKRVGGKKALKASRTRTGIRDAYQDRFLAQLTEVTTKKSRRKVQKEADVASLLATFPNAARLMNPLCRLKGEVRLHSLVEICTDYSYTQSSTHMQTPRWKSCMSFSSASSNTFGAT